MHYFNGGLSFYQNLILLLRRVGTNWTVDPLWKPPEQGRSGSYPCNKDLVRMSCRDSEWPQQRCDITKSPKLTRFT
jgi:hypothetical protein